MSSAVLQNGTRIRATAIERELGTRFTIDTLRALARRYPRRRFVWLMGSDNLAQFARWRHWRAIDDVIRHRFYSHFHSLRSTALAVAPAPGATITETEP